LKELAMVTNLRRAILVVASAVLLFGCSESGAPKTVDPTATPQSHTLKEAAAGADIRVGVAAAPQDEVWNRTISDEFNALSPEGELVWRIIHPGPEEWDFEAADQTLAFAEDHGMFTTISHFVWDQATSISGTPEWVKAINDPAELRQVARASGDNHSHATAERSTDGLSSSSRWNTAVPRCTEITLRCSAQTTSQKRSISPRKRTRFRLAQRNLH
jgi:GH35 family endo-1,4-beta-xylanase